MSSFSNRDSKSPSSDPSPAAPVQYSDTPKPEPYRPTTPQYAQQPRPNSRASLQHGERPQEYRSSSRPMSMVQTYQPPLMDVTQDTLPELQPIFTYLNSHGNKLYQEGYFLKLDDQNSRNELGKLNPIFKVLTIYRWETEC
jgi:CCR4-NOT transcriptional complex subunit CAF120